ncbi:MAG: RES domain-containing protein [Acidobacteriaceae bacterium]
MELEARQPSGPVYRLGRRPNAWQAPEWFLAHADGTFGNRFDDPEGYYRVLYASSQRVTCFVETLARFRPDLSLLAELNAIDGEDDFVPLGTVPRSWLDVRTMGVAEIEGIYADIYAAGWVSHLRRSLAAEALRLGLKDIDLSTLEMAEPRTLTQLASR